MGLLSNESKSKTTVTTVIDRSAPSANDASVAVGKQGSAVFDTLTGSTQFRLGPNAKLNITQTSDPKLLQDFITSQNQLTQSALTQSQLAQADSDKTLAALINKISDLAESKQTGGESARDKTILYVVLAGLAAVAFIFGKGSFIYVAAAGVVGWFLFGKGGK